MAGALAFALVSACTALAWLDESPVTPGRGGRIEGDDRLAWVFLVCAAGALVAYVVGVLVLRRRRASVRAVAAVAAAIQLAPLGAPLLLSSDAWTYWDYGRLAAVHGANPYRETPSDYPSDPAYPYVGAAWRDATSVYGPAFTLASEPLALAVGRSEDAAAWTYKALAAAALLTAAALAARLARRRSLALALVGWNPVLALHFGGGGHNDAWMAALVVAALALGASGRRQLAGAAWAAAVLVKWVPVILLPLRALEARAVARGAAGLAVVFTALAGAATWRYGSAWLEALGPLARNANEETEFAFPHRLSQLGAPRWLALSLVGAGFALAYAWLLREAARGRARLGFAMAAALLATPYLAPWYLAWLVPLAAAEEDEAATWLALALSAYLLPQTIPV